MGDLNAKVGCDNTNHDRAMGKEGCGSMTNNGERPLEFCMTVDLVVRGTLFPHREIHKLTWYSPNGRDKNQIDHLMINGTWRRSLQDVIVRRGADVSSDHHLVPANLKLKLRRNGPEKARQQQCDIVKLKEPRAGSTFTLQLKNKFQALADAEKHNCPVQATSTLCGSRSEQPISRLAKSARDADRIKGMNGSQQIHGKPSRTGRP